MPIVYADTPTQVEEERRLLYVGMTRARDRLHVSWAAARSPGGRGHAGPAASSTRSSVTAADRPAHGRLARRTSSGDQAALTAAGSATSPHRPARAQARPVRRLPEQLRRGRCTRPCALGEASARPTRRCPAYCVFTDATLTALAEIKPVRRGRAGRRTRHRRGQGRQVRRGDPAPVRRRISRRRSPRRRFSNFFRDFPVIRLPPSSGRAYAAGTAEGNSLCTHLKIRSARRVDQALTATDSSKGGADHEELHHHRRDVDDVALRHACSRPESVLGAPVQGRRMAVGTADSRATPWCEHRAGIPQGRLHGRPCLEPTGLDETVKTATSKPRIPRPGIRGFFVYPSPTTKVSREVKHMTLSVLDALDASEVPTRANCPAVPTTQSSSSPSHLQTSSWPSRCARPALSARNASLERLNAVNPGACGEDSCSCRERSSPASGQGEDLASVRLQPDRSRQHRAGPPGLAQANQRRKKPR